MTTLYWGLEYAKVLLCYLFILFIWPSVVFRKYLRGKSKVFRFGFCAVAPVVLYTTVILVLGLLHLLNVWVVNILFYGTFLFGVVKSVWPDAGGRNKLRRLMTSALKPKAVLSGYLSNLRFRLGQMGKRIWQDVRSHLPEYAVLAVLVVYGVIYFSYAPFVEHTYGYGDMNVHHSWIYSMTQGQIFPAGIYPAGMHCVIYLMHTISGLSVYSANLFLGCIQTAVLLLSAYLLMREIFRWRGAPLLVLTVFLTAAVGVSLASGMARLQRTLPGEYGIHTVFLCALFLLRFLKGNVREGWHKDWRAWLKNENLVLFSMALAASVAIHFYVTAMAFFLCLPFAVLYFRKVFSKTRILSITAAVLCGVVIAVFPLVCALISGTPFENSINWAVRVAGGKTTEAVLDELEPAGTGPAQASAASPFSRLAANAKNFFVYGYARLLGDTPGVLIMLCSALMAVFWLAYRLVFMRLRPNGKADLFDCYLPVIIASLIFVAMYAAPYTGLPELISYRRVPYIAYLLLLMTAVIPADVLFSALEHRFGLKWPLQAAPAICVAAACVITLATGNYHGYLYNELTRYRSAVNVTNSITQSFPQYSYTVISSTDDVYQVYEYGRHEELLNFLDEVTQEDSYYLPTEYVFVYVEKKPILSAQYLFSSGPAWLATNRYADEYGEGLVSATRYLDDYEENGIICEMSLYPDILSAQISEADAEKEIPKFLRPYDAYKDLEARAVINSKAYQWCRDFAVLYDHEMKIYYEDDDFICYYFRQNPYSLYDLAIWS